MKIRFIKKRSNGIQYSVLIRIDDIVYTHIGRYSILAEMI